jgi:YD repeat-containing protein
MATIARKPRGEVIRLKFHNAAHNSKVWRANPGIFTSTYDPRNDLGTLVEPGGKTAAWFYDPAKRWIALSAYGKGMFSYVYDAAGRQTQLLTPGLVTTTLGYDALARVTLRQSSNGALATQKNRWRRIRRSRPCRKEHPAAEAAVEEEVVGHPRQRKSRLRRSLQGQRLQNRRRQRRKFRPRRSLRRKRRQRPRAMRLPRRRISLRSTKKPSRPNRRSRVKTHLRKPQRVEPNLLLS